MKRLFFAVMLLLMIACSAFGDLPRADYFRRRDSDFGYRVPAEKLVLNVHASDTEDNTLVMYMNIYGKGSWSYRINNASAGEKILSGSGKVSGRNRITKPWRYEIPEPGQSVRYAVTASFKAYNGNEITAHKRAFIRNVKGVVQIVIE